MDTGRDPSSPTVLATGGQTVTGPRLPERRYRRSGKSTLIRFSLPAITSDTRVGVGAQSGSYDFSDLIHALQYLLIPEAQNSPTLFFESFSAPTVELNFSMLAAVSLNDQASFDASKIGNVGWNGMLPPKMPAVQLMIAQTAP